MKLGVSFFCYKLSHGGHLVADMVILYNSLIRFDFYTISITLSKWR